MKSSSDSPLIDEDTAAFIQRRVSMTAAGRDANNIPASVRAYGCRVSAERRTLTVFVSRPQAAALLENVAHNGALAVVFSRPTTNRTVQFKGVDARVEPLAPGDLGVIAEYVGSFVVELGPLGFPAPYVHAVLTTQPEQMAAITFTPTDGFAQTPGPGAGARLPRS